MPGCEEERERLLDTLDVQDIVTLKTKDGFVLGIALYYSDMSVFVIYPVTPYEK